MRYGKGMAYCLTAVFLAAAVLIGAMDDLPEAEAAGIPLSVSISSETGTEIISCWQQEAGKYYVFLPSYAAGSQMTFRTDGSRDIYIEGSPVEDNMLLSGFQMNTPYEIQISGEQYPSGTIEFVCSANVPTMYLDTHSGNMDYIHAEKGNAEPGRFRLYSPEGVLEHSGIIETINARGNITWELNHDKKPYSLELNSEENLLGLGAARKWILQSNPIDESHLRNKAVFDFADAFGLEFSPDCTWIDLYLNGEYAGLYLLSERNEIHPERVDIDKNGSTLVSIDMWERMERQNYPHIVVDGDTVLRLHGSEKSTDEMTDFWKSVDNAIQAENGIDPVTGKSYLDFIDLDSWTRKYLIEEVFANVEASAVSHYFYIDGTDKMGKVYAGPVWDYDLALGSQWTWQTDVVQALFCARPYVWNETDTPWFYALWQKEEFQKNVIEIYERECRPQIRLLIEDGFDQYTAKIQFSARMNQIRWQTDDGLLETEYIKTYLTKRIDFLDSLWLDGDTYYTVTANRTDGSVVSCFALRPGECVPDLPKWNGENAIGWYDCDTGKPFDITQPIYENKRIYVKREESLPEAERTLRLVIRYMPVTGLLVILLIVWAMDSSRRKRTDIQKNERTKTSKISS